MRKLTVFFIIFGLSILAKADAIHDINQQLQQPDFLTAQFTQHKYLKILKTPLISNGHFWISKNQGIIWQVEKPIFSQIILNKKGIEFSEQQSTQTSKSMEYVGKLLQGLLSGDMQALQAQFDITVIQAANTKTDWEIQLTPKSALLKKGIQAILLSGNQYIHRITLNEASGDKTDIQFIEPTALTALPNELIHVLQ